MKCRMALSTPCPTDLPRTEPPLISWPIMGGRPRLANQNPRPIAQPSKNAMTCVKEISASVSDAIKALPAIRHDTLQIFRHSHTAVPTMQMARTISMRIPGVPRFRNTCIPSKCPRRIADARRVRRARTVCGVCPTPLTGRRKCCTR